MWIIIALAVLFFLTRGAWGMIQEYRNARCPLCRSRNNYCQTSLFLARDPIAPERFHFRLDLGLQRHTSGPIRSMELPDFRKHPPQRAHRLLVPLDIHSDRLRCLPPDDVVTSYVQDGIVAFKLTVGKRLSSRSNRPLYSGESKTSEYPLASVVVTTFLACRPAIVSGKVAFCIHSVKLSPAR
jgi:hypothetical protein